ncbi:MAG: hypothetical protein J6Q22_09595 [Prevotella sp.]|nr:hypothetical protein [Prevotella sp.]
MKTNNELDNACSRASIQNRYGAILNYGGKEVFLDRFFRSESSARNAAIRARARLAAIGIRTEYIRTCTIASHVTGYSRPIDKGVYPSDFNGYRDKAIMEHFGK